MWIYPYEIVVDRGTSSTTLLQTTRTRKRRQTMNVLFANVGVESRTGEGSRCSR